MLSERPVRVQLSRKKGWRMPANTVSVARPSEFGNPFKVGEAKFFINNDDPSNKVFFDPRSVEECVAAFRWLAVQHISIVREKLAGKNLACWCPLNQPCHADVLLELANGSPADAE